MPMRKSFKQCQFEYNTREMKHFRWVDEYCTWVAHAKIALLIPMVIAAMSGEFEERKENKILNQLYHLSIFFTGVCQFLSAGYMTSTWRSVNRYRGVDDRKFLLVIIIFVELLSIVPLSIAIYQYIALPSEKYIKVNVAFFYCIGYEVGSIIATMIYLKFLINYCKELLNYCEKERAIMSPDYNL